MRVDATCKQHATMAVTQLDQVEAEHHDVEGGRQVRWPWRRHGWAA